MESEFCFLNVRDEPYKIKFTSENDKDINCLLDQINKLQYKKVDSVEFTNPITLDIYDESDSYKIGEMTLNDFGIDSAPDNFTFN